MDPKGDNMIKFATGMAVLIALAATPSLAQPAAPDTTHNAQCFVAIAVLANSDKPELKTMGLMGSIFFAGEIFGQNPHIDFTAAIKAAAAPMTNDQAQALRVQCGAEMAARGKEISAAGQSMAPAPAKPL